MQGRKFRLQTEGSSGGLGPQVPSLVDGKSVAAENFSTGMLHLPGRKNFESQGCGREDDRQPRLCQRKSHFSHQRSEISCQQIARPGLGNRTRASIAICHCERQISSVALREKPDLGQDKLSWLQRHDQDCGALYGVLPLCVGMPITATDHLDRGRGILRGCAGVVVGWVWPSETGERTRKENNCVWNQLPACILVRFKTKESWRIDGLPEDNVFPVAPQKKPWYLDKGKRRPMLRVTRKQFPLAPGFATTAHAAQGQTCSEGVLMDMHIGEAGDPLAAYTALTRVKDRQGLFVYRPFAAAPFQKGAKIGRELLLRLWGGEQMDWSYLRAKYRGERQCWECREQKPVGAFTPGRWKRSDEARVCRECMQRHADALEPWQCMACKDWKEESAFAETLARPQCTFYRVCHTCEATKWCDGCSARKTEDKFSRAMWQRKRAGERYCTCCAKKSHGLWTCGGCGTKKRRTEFQICQVHTDQPRVQNGKQLCADCRRPSPGHAIAAKAAAWLAPRRAKLAKKEVAERKERILADVWAEIRKKRAMATVEAMEDPSAKRQKSDGSAPAVPLQTVEATQNGDANETKMEPGSKRKCEARVAEAATHPSVATQVKKRMLPRKQENAVPGKFLYDCPFCHVGVTSSVRTGQVNHCKVCGHFFSVRDGKLARKVYNYVCPFCGGHVASNVKTGQVDHRGVCGNRFYVETGEVKKTRHHAHKCPDCQTRVWSARSWGRIRIKHTKPSGQQCPTSWQVPTPEA